MTEFFGRIYYFITSNLVRGLSLFCFPCKIEGKEHIPVRGSFLLASNHVSNLDPAVVAICCPRQIKFIAKESLFKNPVIGAIIRWGGGYPIKREEGDVKALKVALKRLNDGWPVLLFPQGTRGGNDAKAGVGFLARKAKAPVIPVFVEDTDKVLPKGSKKLLRHDVRVIFGSPMIINSTMTNQQAADAIMSAINDLQPKRN